MCFGPLDGWREERERPHVGVVCRCAGSGDFHMCWKRGKIVAKHARGSGLGMHIGA